MRTAGALSIGILLSTASGLASAQTAPPAPAPKPERIVISGSTTLQPVAEQWAREFAPTRPGLEIVVQGGGTDQGFAALLAGTSQIAMAARQPTDSEKRAFGARQITVEEVVVARDALAVLKNKANPVAELDLATVRRIFTGSIANWREVGGPDQPITVVLRNPSSSTAELFRRIVMANEKLTERGKVAVSQQDVVAHITALPWAVGFAYFDRVVSHLDTVDVLRVRTGEGPAKLVFVSPLYFYARSPLSDNLKALIEFTKSARASEIAVEHGYFGLRDPI